MRSEKTGGKSGTGSAEGSEPLANRSWEAFCAAATGYSGGDPVTATDAYLDAFPRTRSRHAARANAARLAARPEAAARCAWMRKQLAESCLMDSAAIRAKIVRLRLDVIDKTSSTCHKKLALEAARDLDRMGYADAPRPDGTAGGGGAIESITLNVRKLLSEEVRRDD